MLLRFVHCTGRNLCFACHKNSSFAAIFIGLKISVWPDLFSAVLPVLSDTSLFETFYHKSVFAFPG